MCETKGQTGTDENLDAYLGRHNVVFGVTQLSSQSINLLVLSLLVAVSNAKLQGAQNTEHL